MGDSDEGKMQNNNKLNNTPATANSSKKKCYTTPLKNGIKIIHAYTRERSKELGVYSLLCVEYKSE